MQNKPVPTPSGGPGNVSGLLLCYNLTGNERAPDEVVGLADWVINMDDGEQHLLGIASSQSTGQATCTCCNSDHGPGRGVGNSFNALLDLATDAEQYLVKAEQIMRRTNHPMDDSKSNELSRAEERWPYTVQLQALTRFIELSQSFKSAEFARRYARACLLHYARWMAEHERTHPDHPADLEFPTETWTAQDLRKGNMLLMVAGFNDNLTDSRRFHGRGREILDGAWSCLLGFPTYGCTLPVALVFQQGYLQHLEPGSLVPLEFGQPVTFFPQNQKVRDAVRSPLRMIEMLRCALRPGPWLNVANRRWSAQRIRNLPNRIS
jgi:hypothetical protein